MKNILITSSGTGGGYTSSKILYECLRNKVTIIQTDINPKHLVSSSIYSSVFVQSPKVSDKNYTDFILNIIEKNNIDVIIPFIDQDVYIFSKLYEENKISKEIKLQIKKSLIAEICFDKFKAYQWMTAKDIYTPDTFLLDKPVNRDNYIIKPKSGFGSKILFKSGFDFSKPQNIESHIGQEICSYPEVTVDVFNCEVNNDFYFICRERIETKEGVCTKARVFYDKEIGAIARTLAHNLHLNYFCFQLMRLNNKWAITDINPRLGSGTPMGQEVGMDFYKAMICHILDMDYKPYIAQFKGEAFITRQYFNILTYVSK